MILGEEHPSPGSAQAIVFHRWVVCFVPSDDIQNWRYYTHVDVQNRSYKHNTCVYNRMINRDTSACTSTRRAKTTKKDTPGFTRLDEPCAALETAHTGTHTQGIQEIYARLTPSPVPAAPPPPPAAPLPRPPAPKFVASSHNSMIILCNTSGSAILICAFGSN